MGARFTIGEIAEATGGVLPGALGFGSGRSGLMSVSTDTRTLAGGEAFFALAGENHDAHDHLAEAAANGAAMLVVSDAGRVPAGYGDAVLVVADVLRAYQDLAAYHRKRLGVPVIGVTGSVGKTTAKDMIACILAGRAHVHKTAGNFNNQVGLPKTILEAGEEVEALVLEMGMERAGEMKRLAGIARPNVAVITSIGVSHRENFDSDEGILNAKFEIASYMGAGDTLVIDSGGDIRLVKLAEAGSRKQGYAVVCAAEEGTAAASSADYLVSSVRVCGQDAGTARFAIEAKGTGERTEFAVPLPGSYAGISTALAVAACGAVTGAQCGALDFGAGRKEGLSCAGQTLRRVRRGAAERLATASQSSASASLSETPCSASRLRHSTQSPCYSTQDTDCRTAPSGDALAIAAEALKGLARTPHRLEPIRKGGVLIIDDTYNASPDSAKSGLAYLAAVPAERRIAVLADMNELGDMSEGFHREVGEEAARLGTDVVFAYGDKAQAIAEGARDGALNFDASGAEVRYYGTGAKTELIAELCSMVKDGDAVYVKGSRSMKMEEVVQALVACEAGEGK